MKVFILKHAEDDPDIIGGWSDIGLTELGKRQAEEIKNFIVEHQHEMNIKHVVSSEMLRTHLTVDPIAEALNLTVEENELWNGLNQGELNGCSSKKATQMYPYLNLLMMEWDEKFPKGESPKDFQERTVQAWKNLIETYHDDGNILVCTHGINMVVLKKYLAREPWHHKERREYITFPLIEIDTDSKKINVCPIRTPKELKIAITDYHHTFDVQKHYILPLLQKYYNVTFSEKPDFLFYSCFGTDHLNYKDCVRIFLTWENVLPDFNECDYAAGFDYIDFNNRYFHKNFAIPKKTICYRAQVDQSYLHRKFCNFVYSNETKGEGAKLRKEFCQKLMSYKPVDCPGKVLNNMENVFDKGLGARDGDWWGRKINFLKNYKFTISFENSSSVGYTTEKLLHPFFAFSIPIYWGNPMVTKDFNPQAFINCNDFDNDFDAVIERIKELDNDPDKYLAMLRENPMQKNFDWDQNKKFEKWILDIIEKGNKPFNKDPHQHSTAARLYNDLLVAKDLLSKDEHPYPAEYLLTNPPKENIEWSNTWIEDAPKREKKRILIIGDSIARNIRTEANKLLDDYAVDYIGTSAIFEDRSLYNLCTYFFDHKYNYSLILLNIGNQHGNYLKTCVNEKDKKRYKDSCYQFFKYVKDFCSNLVLLTSTPNSLPTLEKYVLDETKNKEIQYRNNIQKQIASDMNIEVLDLYQYVIDEKLEFKDTQHFTDEAQIKLAMYVVSEVSKKLNIHLI